MATTYRACLPTPAPPPPAKEPAYDDVDLSSFHALGTDHHTVPTPVERMVENVLDWEHLPYVHPENFCSTELLGSGIHWYRARVGSPPAERGLFNQVLVCVHPSQRRWFLTLETGPGAGLLFHAHTTRVEPRSFDVELTFYMKEPPRNPAIGRALLDVYSRKLRLLYAQDTDMVVERQATLDRREAGATGPDPAGLLGTVEEVAARVPFLVTVRGRRAWVRHHGDGFAAIAADCPHMGARLPCPDAAAGEVVCPWHAYRFDVADGASTDGRGLHLARAPQVVVRDGRVWIASPQAEDLPTTS